MNLLITDEGQHKDWSKQNQLAISSRPYRLYRFLTDLENLLETFPDDCHRLQLICSLVQRLLNSSPWLLVACPPPDPNQGWSVSMLYEEPDFDLTVQLVSWMPGVVSPIHNHACWGVVALLDGQEKNTLWQRSPSEEFKDKIEPSSEIILTPGDTISFMPNAIHNVEALGDEPTVSFNVYGVTDYKQRFEFDPINNTAVNF